MNTSTAKNGVAKKPLRFAALKRVSTEQQEKEGNSLATQTTQIEQAIDFLDGEIVEWYGGQEHAVAGYEKKEITRLLEDAEKGRFDAVMVTDADRWSRDNESSVKGLEVLKRNHIRFYTGPKEWNLSEPQDKMVLGMWAVLGGYVAENQKKKSIESRIHRARVAGVPTSGKLPFGRTFNRSTGQWGTIPEKKRIIQEAAKRYLKGESIHDLARDYEMNGSNLHKILTKVSGSNWQIEFNSEGLNIKEIIPFNIPPLLDDKTIAAIKVKVGANRTFTHGHIKHQYVFARMISCAHCGYAMFGQTNHNGHRYYRHAHAARDRECSGAKTKKWIPAEAIENAVMTQLFEMFGNPSAVKKAIDKATPCFEKMQELVEEQKSIADELTKIEQGRQRIIAFVAKGTISDESSQDQLSKLNERESKLKEKSARIADELAHVPNKEAVQKFSQKIGGRVLRYVNAKLAAQKMTANSDFDKMTYEEKRELCQDVFSGKTLDGRRMGVWVSWSDDGKNWKQRIEGHLLDEAEPEWLNQALANRKSKKASVSKSVNY